MSNINLENNLIQLRKDKGLTQKELASKLNYSDKVISKWERGESYPNLEALTDISQFFGISMDSLVNNQLETARVIKKTEELSVMKTESPSFLRYLFIVPFIVFTLLNMFTGTNFIGPSISILGFAIIIYSFILSKATFETTYQDIEIKVVNRAFSTKIYVNDDLIIDDKSLSIKVNPLIECEYNNKTIKVIFNNVMSIKCNIYID